MSEMNKKNGRRDIWLATACLGIGAVFGTVALSFADGDDSTSTVLNSNLRIPYKGTLEIDGELGFQSVQMRFELYDTETSMVSKWSETQDVEVNGGAFLVELGQNTPLNTTIYDAEKMWLGITITEFSSTTVEIPLAGRQEIVPAPWAVWSANSADFNVDGNLLVQGDTTLRSDATFGGALFREDVTVTGQARFIESFTALGDMSVSGTSRHSRFRPFQTSASLGTAGLEFLNTFNHPYQWAGVDAVNDAPGVELRSVTDPGTGEPMFRVLSQDGTERLRVEQNGTTLIDNALRVLGTSTLGDGDDTVTINGDLNVTGTMGSLGMSTSVVNASATVTGGSRADDETINNISSGFRACGLTRMRVDRHRSNDSSECYTYNSGGWKIRAKMNGKNNHKVDCSARCMTW